MQVFTALTLLCIFVNASGLGTNEYPRGWHQEVGIKNAEEIKRREDRMVGIGPIVGGVVAPANAHPYLVGLLIDVIGLISPSACGGSLLTANRILTAAHCWFDGRSQAWRITAVLGSQFLFHGGLRIQPNKIALHPRFDPRTFANDVAMLHTPTKVRFSHNIMPIRLPHENLLMMDLTNQWAKASGYGRYSDLTNPTTNAVARSVWLPIISLDACRAFFGDAVLDSNICTNGHGGVGICTGDSGGPLAVTQTDGNTYLVGVSSFVARQGCELGFPSAFARVSYFIDWIRAQL